MEIRIIEVLLYLTFPYTIWHKILTGVNIDRFDELQQFVNIFPIKICYLVSYLLLMNLWLSGSTRNIIISVRLLL